MLHFINGDYQPALAGRIAMSAMLLFTAVAHFVFTNGMTMMIPGFIPLKKILVYITGIFEIIAAICLLMPNLKLLSGWLLIIFFILMLPANIYAASKNINYQQADYNGNGISYLWFRVPLQLFFITWVWLAAIKY